MRGLPSKPTRWELATLRAVESGDSYSSVPEPPAEPFHRVRNILDTTTVQMLIERGWVREPAIPYQGTGKLKLAETGTHVLTDAATLDEWSAVPYRERAPVFVMSAGSGSAPNTAGNNVVCHALACRADSDSGRLVWHTDASGPDATYQAEVQAAKHGLEHSRRRRGFQIGRLHIGFMGLPLPFRGGL